MNKGFSILEVIIALTISLGALFLVMLYISQAGNHSKKVIGYQQKMESIIHTMTMVNADLANCGKRLQEAAKIFNLSLLEYSAIGFRVTIGVSHEKLLEEVFVGDQNISINRNYYFSRGKKIIIFEAHSCLYEMRDIERVKGDVLILDEGLKNSYSTNAIVVVLKEVEYKLYKHSEGNILKRKVNKGYFQPLLENITDFYVSYNPKANSVLYRIEVNCKEQISGYVLLTHMPEVVL